jgi:hypothetical protein
MPRYLFATVLIIVGGIPAANGQPTITLPMSHINQRGICAVPIPAGFDWPADPAELYRISGGLRTPMQVIPGSINVGAQRRHGWKLFAGITQPSTPAPGSLPVFHTWYSVEETFDNADGKVDCATRRPILRLSSPTQMLMALDNPIVRALEGNGFDVSPRLDPNPSLLRNSKNTPSNGSNPNLIAFSHVAFNKDMYDYIRDNKYYLKATLDALIDPNQARRPIKDPPLTGISLKFAWWPASPDQLTPLPVWKFDPRFPGDEKNPPTTWKTVVVVDAKGGQTAPASVKLGGYDHSNPSVVSLDKFYSVQISAEEAELSNADFRLKQAAIDVLGRPLKEGDYLLMTTMHIATREFDPWVFTTFWWTDKPNIGPLSADMPSDVVGVWRNYVMDVSYNINDPKTAQGKAPIAYNPWLELFQLGGTRSQCMACHARAAYGKGVKAFFNPDDMASKDPNGFEGTPVDANDPAYKAGTISLHRIWTIFTRSQCKDQALVIDEQAMRFTSSLYSQRSRSIACHSCSSSICMMT